MKLRVWSVAVLVVVAYGCAATAPVADRLPETVEGVASWYGEEFAGRTTANGEIFDPALLTAAHRTFPFGTILEVTNPRTKQAVTVRVNDRGPYIANRILDLSYAAAQNIGLIEPGIGQVSIRVVKFGSGDREPPVPFEATLADDPKVAATTTSTSDAPAVEFPLPTRPASAPPPVVVDRVEVETQRGDTITRKQVAADGTSVEEVPIAVAAPVEPKPKVEPPKAVAPAEKQFIVQVGAFAQEENAKLLQQRLTSIGQRAWIDHSDLFRVRLGPFATRQLALDARSSLEDNGISAIIVAE